MRFVLWLGYQSRICSQISQTPWKARSGLNGESNPIVGTGSSSAKSQILPVSRGRRARSCGAESSGRWPNRMYQDIPQRMHENALEPTAGAIFCAIVFLASSKSSFVSR
ncbi:hypothetical protein BV25DRAFT_1833375 [Artomyces pyxidatus]|uniref:Uncharacterized protein n=1 Tax=Artomyces pyxidatus TaxID=48021 RepID=A0ACB8SFX3_9AGAM|nr:hypothetical protein BV25DRAFT_1833375 [Artomyces pyxidatus]